MRTETTGTQRDRTGRPTGPRPVRDRHLGWAGLAVVLVVGLGVLGGFAYLRAGAKTPVVVMARTVQAGHVITRTDLSTVGVAGALTTIAAGDLDRVVGRRAAVTMLAGTPVQRSMLSSDGALQAGQAHVGLAVTSGQIPSDGVRVGDTVEVLRLPGTGTVDDPTQPAQVLVQSASVWSARADPARPGGFLLTVTVPDEMVADVVSASGAGQAAVVRVVSGS
jgi:hypothetical protein